MINKTLGPKSALLALIALAVAGPLILYPIELLLPYPHIVEEIFKLLTVIYILNLEKISGRNYFWLGVVFALFFVMSESVFYLMNIFMVGDFSHFFLRLIYTTPLHLGTVMLLYFGFRQKGFFWSGLALVVAILIHYYYNLLI